MNPPSPLRVVRQLEEVDWDFPVSVEATLGPVHWYPGTFAAALPAALIQALSRPGDLVFDPYGGVGTAATEALRLNRRAWNVDINPPALLASYTSAGLILLRRFSGGGIDAAFDAVELSLAGFRTNDTTAPQLALPQPPPGHVDKILSGLLVPTPSSALQQFLNGHAPNGRALSRWLDPLVLSNAERLFRYILDADLDAFCKVLAIVMLSAVLKSVSSQTRSWGHIADNVLPKTFVSKDLLTYCKRWLQRTRSECKRLIINDECSSASRVHFRMQVIDWTNGIKMDSLEKARLMITSPPYAGAIDYTLGQRLSLYLFGLDDSAVEQLCHREIGARRKRFSSNHLSAWADELVAALECQLKCVRNDGFVCLVMPHKDAGRELGTSRVEGRLGELGWRKFFEVDRSIRQMRTRQSWTSIKKETVQIYAR